METKIPHPFLQNRHFYFIPDPVHVFKNVRTALCSGRKFKLAEEFVTAWKLDSAEVNFDHLDSLCMYQNKMGLKLAPKLHQDILHPKHFDKMNVRSAMAIFSKTTSSALEYAVENCGFPRDVLTTAKFVNVMQHWFSLVNSRCPTMALSLSNSDKFRESESFLRSVIGLFQSLRVDDGRWKPYQTAVIASTTSILSLAKDLLEKENFGFFLTSRLSQDSLENTFSMIRNKNPVPTAREFKYNLRAICAAQYLKEKKSSSYEFDDSTYLVNCLGNIEKDKSRNGVDDEVEEFAQTFALNHETTSLEMEMSEKSSLYYFSGYIVQSVLKKQRSCETCVKEFADNSNDSVETDVQKLQNLRAFKKDSLLTCSEKAYNELFLKAESLIRSYDEKELLRQKDVIKKLTAAFSTIDRPSLKVKCHDLESPVIYRFFKARLHIISQNNRKERNSGNERASKSTEMRRLVNQV